MKTLKTMVVCEDIHTEDYDMRRHWVETMEREDCVVSLFPFLLCWVIGTTVLLSGVQENQSEWLKWCLNKTYVFEWRLWERILSRVRQVSFAWSPSKVAVWVWNLTVGTRVSSLVTQGHFGQIRSGCQVAINSPPLQPKTVGCSDWEYDFCRLRATHH